MEMPLWDGEEGKFFIVGDFSADADKRVGVPE
jgi:hypothetical protein